MHVVCGSRGWHTTLIASIVFSLVVGLGRQAIAQKQTPPKPDAIAQPESISPTLAERFEAVLAELQAAKVRADQLEKSLEETKQKLEQTAQKMQNAIDGQSELIGTDLDDFDARLSMLGGKVDQPVNFRFLLAGTAAVGASYTVGKQPTYAAAFSPHFLWMLYEKVLFESHVDVKSGSGSSSLNVEFAQLWFVLNDHITLGVGKFLTPFGFYMEQIHTAWINRLPDEPLVVADHVGLAPTHMTGLQLRGAAELGRGRLNYALYTGSAPVLELPEDGGEPHIHLDFDQTQRLAGGGRVGYLPVPALELGYSVQLARVDPVESDLNEVYALIHGLDITYSDVISPLSGFIDAHAEIFALTLDERGVASSPYDATRLGAYAQLAYSPSEVSNKMLNRTEVVARVDYQDLEADDGLTWRITGGLNFWIQPSVVLKMAYQHGATRPDEGPSTQSNRIMFQAAAGF